MGNIEFQDFCDVYSVILNFVKNLLWKEKQSRCFVPQHDKMVFHILFSI